MAHTEYLEHPVERSPEELQKKTGTLIDGPMRRIGNVIQRGVKVIEAVTHSKTVTTVGIASGLTVVGGAILGAHIAPVIGTVALVVGMAKVAGLAVGAIKGIDDDILDEKLNEKNKAKAIVGMASYCGKNLDKGKLLVAGAVGFLETYLAGHGSQSLFQSLGERVSHAAHSVTHGIVGSALATDKAHHGKEKLAEYINMVRKGQGNDDKKMVDMEEKMIKVLEIVEEMSEKEDAKHGHGHDHGKKKEKKPFIERVKGLANIGQNIVTAVANDLYHIAESVTSEISNQKQDREALAQLDKEERIRAKVAEFNDESMMTIAEDMLEIARTPRANAIARQRNENSL
jgi:hypothetical protein